MVFSIKSGYEFSKIRIDTNNHEGHMTSDVIYDVSAGIGDDSIFINGNYEYTAEDVTHGLAVVVETRPITYTLTTSKDEGSGITEGRTYTHHDTENLTVIFGTYSGYEIDTLTVNETTYSSVEEMEDAGIVLSRKETAYASDGSTHTAALYGSIELPRTQDNEVSVTSKKRYYKVVFEEYIQEFSNGAIVYTPHTTSNAEYLEFGALLPSAPHAAGSVEVIGSDNYTLSDWYSDYNGSVFYNVINVPTATVPANDITLHAFWKKNPNVVLSETVKIEKIADDDTAGEIFTFGAFIHEHLVGTVTITDSGEADMTITLTDRQNEEFEAGEIIRIREVIPLDDDDWHYDTTVYNLTYDAGGNILKNGNDTVTKAVFTNIKNSYTVKYDLAGGLVDGAQLDPKTVKWNDSNLFGIDDIPMKEGSTFAGWKYGAKDVQTSDTYGDLAEDKALKEITLVAQYETRTYTVMYDLNGGNISGETTVADKSVGYFDRNLLPSGTATRDGYTLVSWTYGAKVVTNTNTYASLANDHDLPSITLVANWEVDEIGGDPDPGETPDNIPDKYQKQITFKIVNGKWEDGTSTDKVYVVDLKNESDEHSELGKADISGIIPVNMTANSGYRGGEWDVTPPAEVSGSEAVTYTYTYTRSGGGGGGGSSKYVLTYDSNGGTEFPDEKHSPGTTVELDNVPKKDGYIFDGWHLDEALNEDTEEVTMTKNITVYAAWIEDNGAAGNGHDTPSSLNGDDHFAYVVGYPDGNVKPHNNITRAEVTSIFFRLLKDDTRNSNLAYTNAFNDADSDDWFNTAVSTMSKLGIVNGRKSYKFAPNEYITRAEFAVICARFDNSEYVVSDEFTDVNGHWAEEEIHEAAAHGWIRGYENGTFRPDAYITRAEAMTMINRVLNRVPESDNDLLPNMVVWPDNSDKTAWYYLPVQEATNSHNFEMKNNIYERWTSLEEARDWTQYE